MKKSIIILMCVLFGATAYAQESFIPKMHAPADSLCIRLHAWDGFSYSKNRVRNVYGSDVDLFISQNYALQISYMHERNLQDKLYRSNMWSLGVAKVKKLSNIADGSIGGGFGLDWQRPDGEKICRALAYINANIKLYYSGGHYINFGTTAFAYRHSVKYAATIGIGMFF